MEEPGTLRLYYEDAYRTEFEADVLKRRTVEGRPAVVLDRTCFYPDSGGQPADRGMIAGADVLSVIEDGDAIVHVLSREVEGGRVRGSVDRAARFDHMQQHTGQHILSQAFIEIVNGETKSFHMGADSATLEIGIGAVADETLDRVERRANEVIFQDRTVKTYFVPPERVAEVPFRRPPKKEGVLRVVEVEGFDYSACGGTHCRSTGEVGLVKITGRERIRGNLRFVFVCGGRALADFQIKNRVVSGLAGRFNVPPGDVPGSVDKLAAELAAAKKESRRLGDLASSYEARDIIAAATSPVIVRVFRDRGPDAARTLALNIVRRGGVVVLFAAFSESRCHLLFARSDGLEIDLRRLVPVVAPIVNGRGGGGPSLVEIAGEPAADADTVLARAAEVVAQTLGLPGGRG